MRMVEKTMQPAPNKHQQCCVPWFHLQKTAVQGLDKAQSLYIPFAGQLLLINTLCWSTDCLMVPPMCHIILLSQNKHQEFVSICICFARQQMRSCNRSRYIFIYIKHTAQRASAKVNRSNSHLQLPKHTNLSQALLMQGHSKQFFILKVGKRSKKEHWCSHSLQLAVVSGLNLVLMPSLTT